MPDAMSVCLEFHDAPDQAWHNDPRNDWRYTLQHLAGAIACSQESAQAVRNLMGDSYPVTAIPPRSGHILVLMPSDGWQPSAGAHRFGFSGHVIDSDTLGLSANGLVSICHGRRATLLSEMPPQPALGI